MSNTVHSMYTHWPFITLWVYSQPSRQQQGMWAPSLAHLSPPPPSNTHSTKQCFTAVRSRVHKVFIPPPSFHAPPAKPLHRLPESSSWGSLPLVWAVLSLPPCLIKPGLHYKLDWEGGFSKWRTMRSYTIFRSAFFAQTTLQVTRPSSGEKQAVLGTDSCQNGSIFCKNRCPLQPAPLAQTHGMHKNALLGSFELGRPGKNFRPRRGAV